MQYYMYRLKEILKTSLLCDYIIDIETPFSTAFRLTC